VVCARYKCVIVEKAGSPGGVGGVSEGDLVTAVGCVSIATSVPAPISYTDDQLLP